MSRITRHFLIAAAIAATAAGTGAAQLLPGLLPGRGLPVGNLPVAGPMIGSVLDSPAAAQAVRPRLNFIRGLPAELAQSGAQTLAELRQRRLARLLSDHRDELERGDHGLPVRRGVVIAINPDAASLRIAGREGFRVIRDEVAPTLALRLVTLAVPRGDSARSALKHLVKRAPRLQAELDYVFEPAGGALLPAAGAVLAARAGDGLMIGMIDGGVASHPSLARASIEQRGFAGTPQATGHGTAIASLIVGSQGPFHGAATSASLLVADVYGGNPAAGSATAIVRALDWLAAKRPTVINISLVGPANKLVARAIQSVRGRGIQLVAAVGNDGPAAPPQYPASYPGVIAVTGVDSHGRALIEAGKAKHLDFAAPGADMAAATPGRGYDNVRGTSFASPLVAARLALAGSISRLASEARPGKGRVGRGIVCAQCRIAPKAVGAR